MYFCYIDESGTSNIPGNTSHFVLAGISLPITKWRECDRAISKLKEKYKLDNEEIHTGWIMRPYIEQSKIVDFDKMSYSDRRANVESYRKKEIYRLQKQNDPKALKRAKKNYKSTHAYTHLSYDERMSFLREVADYVGKCSYIRLFAECIDKVYFDPSKAFCSVDEQALEQLVSRFERYLVNVSKNKNKYHGILIHDDNQTISKKHTLLMKRFHSSGTHWTTIKHIIETPLFVNSELTSMIQIADLCSFTLRRYFENNDTDLFDRIQPRIDTAQGRIVGVRHYTDHKKCSCIFCQ